MKLGIKIIFFIAIFKDIFTWNINWWALSHSQPNQCSCKLSNWCQTFQMMDKSCGLHPIQQVYWNPFDTRSVFCSCRGLVENRLWAHRGTPEDRLNPLDSRWMLHGLVLVQGRWLQRLLQSEWKSACFFVVGLVFGQLIIFDDLYLIRIEIELLVLQRFHEVL